MSIISSNSYLTLEQMAGNAQYIMDYLTSRGWTKNAVAGMLGNMQSESNINPGIWQSLATGRTDLGYGLVQWTPATKYIGWAQSKGYALGDINGQLVKITEEVASNTQWQHVTTTMNFIDFTKSTDSVETLAELFEMNYEQHDGAAQPVRKTQARYWFDHLNAGANTKIMEVIALVKSRIGKNTYTNDPARENVFGGWSDCSSLMWKCFKQAGGIFIGSYTDEQLTYGRQVWQNGNGSHIFTLDMQKASTAQPGDLIFWGNTQTDATHVEMYLGNNQIIGHGSGIGPTVKQADAYNHPNVLLQVRRYIEGTVTPSDPIDSKRVSIVSFIAG